MSMDVIRSGRWFASDQVSGEEKENGEWKVTKVRKVGVFRAAGGLTGSSSDQHSAVKGTSRAMLAPTPVQRTETLPTVERGGNNRKVFLCL